MDSLAEPRLFRANCGGRSVEVLTWNVMLRGLDLKNPTLPQKRGFWVSVILDA